ncbi:hypothetical protein PEX1_044900 [Penicillium expansum]|uniref:Uncharacterized protein n=1 Tax=Penicillium expansum TaxID=27334 RepID=A0A0A2IM84_PENEN|nr:hypothetical protein PEX2_046950 [Penicillium expansum]KGO39670.1 hypothetical protein PEXP_048460 [Penicillium expansum]KGO41375.1 hypothetical protein PEX1_044900 [Penicillium expansum]KGO62669.1 hypothetical protein PEX2_046950 [Penicillium expansum]
MGISTPAEPAPAYEDLFHERGSSSRNGYAMVGQIDDDTTDAHRDVEQGHHLHTVPAPIAVTVADEPDQHTHCAECDRQQERRERRESSQKACTMVATTFILISLFLAILGIVGVGAWKDVRLKKLHG